MASFVDIIKVQKAIAKKQKTIDEASRKIKQAPKSAKIGWDSKSGTYPEQDGKPVEWVAAVHEYGYGKNTEKRMSRNTKFLHEKEWIMAFRKDIYSQLKRGKLPDFRDTLENLGEQVKTDLRNYLYQIDLIDTHRLANSIIVRYRRRK